MDINTIVNFALGHTGTILNDPLGLVSAYAASALVSHVIHRSSKTASNEQVELVIAWIVKLGNFIAKVGTKMLDSLKATDSASVAAPATTNAPKDDPTGISGG